MSRRAARADIATFRPPRMTGLQRSRERRERFGEVGEMPIRTTRVETLLSTRILTGAACHSPTAWISMYTADAWRNPTIRRARCPEHRSQAVRCRRSSIHTYEVHSQRVRIGSCLPATDWGPYSTRSGASDAFMENVEDLPVQEREP